MLLKFNGRILNLEKLVSVSVMPGRENAPGFMSLVFDVPTEGGNPLILDFEEGTPDHDALAALLFTAVPVFDGDEVLENYKEFITIRRAQKLMRKRQFFTEAERLSKVETPSGPTVEPRVGGPDQEKVITDPLAR